MKHASKAMDDYTKPFCGDDLFAVILSMFGGVMISEGEF